MRKRTGWKIPWKKSSGRQHQKGLLIAVGYKTIEDASGNSDSDIWRRTVEEVRVRCGSPLLWTKKKKEEEDEEIEKKQKRKN